VIAAPVHKNVQCWQRKIALRTFPNEIIAVTSTRDMSHNFLASLVGFGTM
jgi:hypothetical protein